MLSPEETQKVKNRLDLNERLVWAGKPKPRAFTKTTVGAMLFGIPWSAFVAFFLYFGFFGDVKKTGAAEDPLSLSLFMIPFVLVGLGMLFAPFWNRLRMAGQLYAVTDKSALVIGRLFTKRWRAGEMDTIDRRDKRNGHSDLIFAYTSYAVNGQHLPTGFLNIPTTEASAAESALRALKEREGPQAP